MPKRFKNILSIKVIFCYCLILLSFEAIAVVPLIPRNVLFSNPAKVNPALSPDGKYLAFLAPIKGVLNIWVANSHDLSSAKPLTQEKKRNIREYFWALNQKFILYFQDTDGDEDFHLYHVDLNSGQEKDLTPFLKTRAELIKTSMIFPDEILIGLNNRNSEWHDVYRLNIVSGKLKLIETNNRFIDYVADEKLNLRVARHPTGDNTQEYFFKDKDGKWQFYARVRFEDILSSGFIGFNRAGTIAYQVDSQDRDFAAIYAVDFSNKQKTLIAEDPKTDITSTLFHPFELTLQGYATEYLKTSWSILDKRIQADFAYLKAANYGDFEITDRTLADDKWLVRYYSDIKPSRYYLYERDPKTNTPKSLSFLFTTFPQYTNQPFVPMQPVIIKSRDGLDLVSYLSLPKNSLAKTKSMVLFVHGGPWDRDSWGLNRMHQWLANRGYAVLSVNYRGSTPGFGKLFINAGNKEWGGKMHTDLIDAVNWAIKQKIADPQKIAIMGGSYGGYATLVGLTFTPDVFNCGVSIVGPSNLFTLIKTVPEYWKPDLAIFRQRVGDIDSEEGRKFLATRSPLTYVTRIKKPLLILHGEHDPRVKKAESEQIVARMQHANIPVTYVLYHDEGHGFVREPNMISSMAIIEQFLAENLGGRAEPIGKDFQGANFSIMAGKNFIRGLSK